MLSSNHPPPTLAVASMRTLLPPLLPQFSPCQQSKTPILAKKATMFSMALAHLLEQGTLLESPTSHLAPCCGHTNQVALLEPYLQGMYVTYPYLESHKERLPSPIRLLKYLITTKIQL
jgi:hypothetical protein